MSPHGHSGPAVQAPQPAVPGQPRAAFFDWSRVRILLPFLREYRGRVVAALSLLQALAGDLGR